MNRFAMAGVILLMACSAWADDATTQPTGSTLGTLGTPIELFNGRNLDGWVWVQRKPTTPDAVPAMPIEKIWSVVDGVLKDAGKPIGYIRTERKFTNFMLTVEQRHTAGGNGGILFAISGPDKVWPHCLECQGLVGSEGDIRGVANFKLVSDPARTERQRIRRIGNPEKPIGEWSSVVVIVNHGQIAIRINDHLANEASTTDDLTGCIGLQAEGGAMEFRKIELTPIDE